jgi:hypothetical protein
MPLSIYTPPDAVAEIKGGGYIVVSKSVEGAFRLVWGNECSCPATGKSCRHRKLVSAYCAQQDAARRRPAGKVSASLMCD